ncbi:MAG: MFS transporter [Limisphaerales bacterium]
MNNAVRWKLFAMMVLEFIIWGAWLPLIYSYLPSLNFTPLQQTAILNAFPVATLVAIFFSNQFADRNFAAERFLAFSQLVGGIAILGLAFTRDFWTFFILMLVHCLLYVPTLSIANSIAFANLKDSKDFGLIRMGGSIGWIVAAWPLTFIKMDVSDIRWTYLIAGVASFILAGFSLTLPHTPPKKAEAVQDKLAWVEAMRLLKQPFVLVLWILALVDAFVIYAYFNWAGTFLGSQQVGIPTQWIMPVMSIGQVAEILTMAILGMTLKRLGWRLTMIIGIMGHVVRFAVFAFFPQITWLIIAVFLLHGICYAFFFATVYIFVDEYFPKDVRSSAQGLFNVMILGLGAIAANTICPRMTAYYTVQSVIDFRTMFVIAGGVALAAAIILALFFHPPARGTAAEQK